MEQSGKSYEKLIAEGISDAEFQEEYAEEIAIMSGTGMLPPIDISFPHLAIYYKTNWNNQCGYFMVDNHTLSVPKEITDVHKFLVDSLSKLSKITHWYDKDKDLLYAINGRLIKLTDEEHKKFLSDFEIYLSSNYGTSGVSGSSGTSGVVGTSGIVGPIK